MFGGVHEARVLLAGQCHGIILNYSYFIDTYHAFICRLVSWIDGYQLLHLIVNDRKNAGPVGDDTVYVL